MGAHSARESKLRLALTLAGLPRPETQGRIEADGTLVAQVDLLYRYYRVALEYEGGQHLTDPDQWQKDITRYADLVRMGFTVVRVTSTRMRKPDDVVNEVFRGLVDHGYAGPAPRFSPSWCVLCHLARLQRRRAVSASKSCHLACRVVVHGVSEVPNGCAGVRPAQAADVRGRNQSRYLVRSGGHCLSRLARSMASAPE